jgi:hypothetical protein
MGDDCLGPMFWLNIARHGRSRKTAKFARMIVARVRFDCVAAEAGYGLSAPFRQRFTARKLSSTVGIPRHRRAELGSFRLNWPIAVGGRPHRRAVQRQ